MIHGIGIDIVEVKRIKNMIEKWGDRFLNRVFTSEEIKYCNRMRFPEIHYAVRFAAKEAFYKALGSQQNGGIFWNEIGVVNDTSGRPCLNVTGKTKKAIDEVGIKNIYISLSHEKEVGIAQITLET